MAAKLQRGNLGGNKSGCDPLSGDLWPGRDSHILNAQDASELLWIAVQEIRAHTVERGVFKE